MVPVCVPFKMVSQHPHPPFKMAAVFKIMIISLWNLLQYHSIVRWAIQAQWTEPLVLLAIVLSVLRFTNSDYPHWYLQTLWMFIWIVLHVQVLFTCHRWFIMWFFVLEVKLGCILLDIDRRCETTLWWHFIWVCLNMNRKFYWKCRGKIKEAR